MTDQDIIKHFGETNQVYVFSGSTTELVQYCESNDIGYNYLVTNYTVYFIAISGTIVADSRIAELVPATEPAPPVE